VEGLLYEVPLISPASVRPMNVPDRPRSSTASPICMSSAKPRLKALVPRVVGQTTEAYRRKSAGVVRSSNPWNLSLGPLLMVRRREWDHPMPAGMKCTLGTQRHIRALRRPLEAPFTWVASRRWIKLVTKARAKRRSAVRTEAPDG
jgi:hypothetical protein